MGNASDAQRANVRQTPIWCAPLLLLLLAMPARAEIQGQTVGIDVLTDMGGVDADASGFGSLVAEKLAAEDTAAFVPSIAIKIIAAGESKGACDDDKLARRTLGEAAFRALSEEDCPIAS